MASSEIDFKSETFRYVLVVSPPKTGQLTFDYNKLSGAFGDIGRGTIVQNQNGFAIQVGANNEIAFRPPQVIFKAASKQLLVNAYKNAKHLMLSDFFAEPARAFGVNFDLTVEWTDRDWNEIFQGFLNVGIARLSRLARMTVVIDGLADGEAVNIMTEKSNLQNNALFFSVNHHIANPGVTSYSPDELEKQVDQRFEFTKAKLTELLECTRKTNA